MSDIRVKGLASLNEFLQALPVKVERNVLRAALRTGAKVIEADARSRIRSRSGALAADLKSGSRTKGARVIGYVRNRLFYAPMVERGTRKHFISVDMDARPSRITRRGRRAFGIGTINRMLARGSLVIGGNLVGGQVVHPGSRPYPYLRPALDSRGQDAVVAAAVYMRGRLASKHGLDTAALEFEVDL